MKIVRKEMNRKERDLRIRTMRWHQPKAFHNLDQLKGKKTAMQRKRKRTQMNTTPKKDQFLFIQYWVENIESRSIEGQQDFPVDSFVST